MAEEEIIVDDKSTEDEEDAFKEPQSDKTEDEESRNKEEDESKPRRSEIAEKKHWRGKAQQASKKVQELTEELEKLKGAVKKPDDEKEAAAQEYIRNQARTVYKELQIEKAKEESKELATFEEQVEEI